MKQRDQRLLEATHRLTGTPDFEAFLGWLKESLAETYAVLVRAESEAELRQRQGEARVLEDILARVGDTSDALSKLTGRGR